jgi:hypothetical protein
MPASQGYIGTGGSEFVPTLGALKFVPAAFRPAPKSDYIGMNWAPGQGGDTPGGGGAALIGETQQVDVAAWYSMGFVIPFNASHAPGAVGAQSRRGRAG